MKKVSLIIPSRNEEQNIADFFALAEQTLKPDFAYQYIFVNDGSKDKTLTSIQNLISANPDKEIIGIDFSRNFGKEAAILAGLKQADGDYISLIDADLQQHPKYINQMTAMLEQNPDLDMIACYQDKRKEGLLIKGFKNLFYRLINQASDTKFEKNASDFRTFRKNVAQSILTMGEYHRFSKGLFAWVGFNVAYIPYQVEERRHGKSNWSFRSLTRYAFDGFFDYSILPLRIATYLGFFTSFAALVYFIVILIQKFSVGIEVKGYATIVSLILLLSGVQLICMGIIGEYLARTYMQSKQRPHYLIKKIYTSEHSDFPTASDEIPVHDVETPLSIEFPQSAQQPEDHQTEKNHKENKN